jgi:hypothetical protein
MLRNNGRHNFRSPFGVQPSLVLDFAGTGTLDSRVTFTRSTTATYYNSSGVLSTAAINAPRFDYNPSTLAPLGLLIEQSSTNFCLQSTNIAFTPTWLGDTSGGSVPTVTGNYATAPDGTTTATRIQLNRGAGTYSRWQQIITGVASSIYTGSIWMKTTSGTGTANVGLRIDSTGENRVVTGQWQRFSLPTSVASIAPSIQIISFTSIPGTDVSADILVWGGQVEPLAFPTSYIPTTSAQVTRASDNASMTGTNFSSWYNNAQGSFYAEAKSIYNTSATGGARYLLANTNLNAYYLYTNQGSTNMQNYDGATAIATAVTDFSVFNKFISTYGTSTKTITNNGLTVTSGAYNQQWANNTGLGIGSGNPNGGLPWNGWIKKVSFYSIQFTSAQQQSLTGS